MIAPNPNPVSSNAPQPKNFTPLVRQFLDYLKLEKHFSDYTIKSYGADLIQFGQFMAGEIGHANAAAAPGAAAQPVNRSGAQLGTGATSTTGVWSVGIR